MPLTDTRGNRRRPPVAGRPPAPSLRLRLIALAGVVVLFSLGLLGYALDRAYQRAAEARVEERLQSVIYLAMGSLEVDEGGELNFSQNLPEPRLNSPGSGLYIAIDAGGERWLSPSALTVELPELEAIAPGQSHFTITDDPDFRFIYHYGLVFELIDGGDMPLSLAVIEDNAIYRSEVAAFRSSLWRWLLVAAGVLILMQLLFLRLSLRPLRNLSEDVAQVEAGNAETLSGSYPREVAPLTRNLNRLLQTEKANQQRYRNALDQLAHGLKTPLAVLQASLPEAVADKHSRRSMARALEDMQTRVTQQLERAALSTRRTLVQPVPVRPEAERLARSLDKVYADKQIQVEMNVDQGVTFQGERRDLLEILGNLLDNAFKYTRSRIRLSAERVAGGELRPGLELCVEDDGPGIQEAFAEQVFERGIRGDEQLPGHGLGLAIVSELVAAYDGHTEIGTSDLGGARLRIHFPPS